MDDLREEDASLFGPETQSFPADEPARNPFDEPAYPEDDEPGVSFPSIFMASDAGLTGATVAHVFDEVKKLIDRCLDTDTLPVDTVNMVHEFYEDRIRRGIEGMPPWSRRSIYNYIYKGHERQADQVRTVLISIRQLS